MTESRTIDASAVRWRAAEPRGSRRDLLVVLHGLGSHEGDLFMLAPFLPTSVTIAALRAPLRYGGGWAWFDFGTQESTDHHGIDASCRGVLSWLDEHAADYDRIGLLGFSQGGAMALQLLRHAPERFSYVLQLSGFVFAGGHPNDDALRALSPRIPAFQAYGEHDEVIASSATERTAAWMQRYLDNELHAYPVGHSVSQQELHDIVAFLDRVTA